MSRSERPTQQYEVLLAVRGDVPDVLVQLDFRVEGADDMTPGIVLLGEDGQPGLLGYCTLEASSEDSARAEMAQVLDEEGLTAEVSIAATRPAR